MAFIIAGIPPIVAAVFLCLIYKINDNTTTISPVLLESEQRAQILKRSETKTIYLSSIENDKIFENNQGVRNKAFLSEA